MLLEAVLDLERLCGPVYANGNEPRLQVYEKPIPAPETTRYTVRSSQNRYRAYAWFNFGAHARLSGTGSGFNVGFRVSGSRTTFLVNRIAATKNLHPDLAKGSRGEANELRVQIALAR